MENRLKIYLVSVSLMLLVGSFIIGYEWANSGCVGEKVPMVFLQEANMSTKDAAIKEISEQMDDKLVSDVAIEKAVAVNEKKYIPMEESPLPEDLQRVANDLILEINELAKAENEKIEECDGNAECEEKMENSFQSKFEELLEKYEKYF